MANTACLDRGMPVPPPTPKHTFLFVAPLEENFVSPCVRVTPALSIGGSARAKEGGGWGLRASAQAPGSPPATGVRGGPGGCLNPCTLTPPPPIFEQAEFPPVCSPRKRNHFGACCQNQFQPVGQPRAILA